ncbi:MAG: winged helix-turn-helix domain-containing protein [Bacteroidales bacterium]|nr:winged helix-turn-helix domain-containing protein [Bacteroidales bacterium]
MSKKTTKTTKTAPKKAPAKAKPAPEAKPEIIDAGGGILVEIAKPTKKAKAPKLVEGSLSAAFREAGDIHGISDPPEKPAKKAKPTTDAKPKNLSALDAAAKVLAEVGQPMNAKEMIDAMAKAGYWTSPGGKTPHATLYAAILREIGAKGKEARFAKTSKGHFASNA